MLSDLLGPEQILIDLRVNNKAQLLQELSRRAAVAIGIDEAHIFEALQARENLGSTGLGKGFALPHARLESIETPFLLLARLAKPIDFEAIDERPVDLVILLLTPSNRPNAHLSTLAAVSRSMRDETMLKRLRSARSAAQLRELLLAA
jgi:nitrogen PTS system EIIA component